MTNQPKPGDCVTIEVGIRDGNGHGYEEDVVVGTLPDGGLVTHSGATFNRDGTERDTYSWAQRRCLVEPSEESTEYMVRQRLLREIDGHLRNCGYWPRQRLLRLLETLKPLEESP